LPSILRGFKGAWTLVDVLKLSYTFHQKCSKLDAATTESFKKTITRLKIQILLFLDLFWAHKNVHFKELAKAKALTT
jgi:hypothetical protein